MPFSVVMIAEPDADVSAADARAYLADFVEWVVEFLGEVADESGYGGELAALFVTDQIAYLPAALTALIEDGILVRAASAVREMPVQAVVDHGLYGVQAKWKFSNVNHWLGNFIQTPGAKLFKRLLDSIDALLESILDGVPGGGAIIELKELTGNSLDIEDE